MNIPYLDFPNASFKDYEYIPGQNFYRWARHFAAYVDNWQGRGHWSYRQECIFRNKKASRNIPEASIRNSF